MKKLLMVFIAALLIIPGAFALQISSPTLTGNSGEIVSTAFTITNNDTKSLSNFNIKSDAQSSYDVQFLNVPQTLAPGSSAQVTVKGKIPSGLSAKQFIGKIYVNATWTSNSGVLTASFSHNIASSAASVSAFVHPSLQSPTSLTLSSTSVSTVANASSVTALSTGPTAIGTAISLSMEWLSSGACNVVDGTYSQIPDCSKLQNVKYGNGKPVASTCDSTKFKNVYVDKNTYAMGTYAYYTCEKVYYALSEGPTVPPEWNNNSSQTGVVYGSADLYMQPSSSGSSGGSGGSSGGSGSQGYLVIDRVRMTCDGKTTTINDESSVEMNPGQKCELTIRIKNNHPSQNMEDVEVEVDPDNNDVDGGSDSISSISDGNTDEVSIPLEIAKDADSGDVDVTVRVDGEDESGKKYSDTLEFNVEIKRKPHDMRIEKILTSPSNLNACTNTRVDVTVSLENAGDRDEKRVSVELNVPGLNFIKKLVDIEVDKGDEERATFTVPLSSLAKGAYKGTVKVFYENIVVSEQKDVTINVQGCEEDESEQTSTTVPLTELPPIVPEVNANELGGKTSSSTVSKILYTIILVGANVAALTVLGVMGYGLFKKKDEEFEQDKDEQVPAQFY